MKNRNYGLVGLVILLGLAFLGISYFLPIATLAALLIGGMFATLIVVIGQVISLFQRLERQDQIFDKTKWKLGLGSRSRPAREPGEPRNHADQTTNDASGVHP